MKSTSPKITIPLFPKIIITPIHPKILRDLIFQLLKEKLLIKILDSTNTISRMFSLSFLKKSNNKKKSKIKIKMNPHLSPKIKPSLSKITATLKPPKLTLISTKKKIIKFLIPIKVTQSKEPKIHPIFQTMNQYLYKEIERELTALLKKQGFETYNKYIKLKNTHKLL
jgi:hypothetical protein